ncbi:MAG: SDR family oxidoreductase [Actinomycetota bacterium]|nr:SDR family oxidoreductase [Actinomycetota bacterium]
MGQEPQPLRGQVGLVTGASRGIGHSVALRLAEAGAGVAITARTQQALQETKGQIEDLGGRCEAMRADVSSPQEVSAAVAGFLAAFGHIDVLVNNAGRVMPKTTPLVDVDPDEWWNVVEVNLRGPMLMTHAVLPKMIERGRGRIFNVGSLVGTRPLHGFSAYSISKAGLIRLTDSVNAELAGTGCFVFELSPGLVKTAMTDEIDIFDDVPEDDWTPVERTGEVIVELCSGRYDALAGRFIHATDDLEKLLAMIEASDPDARRLRLFPAGPNDHLLE